jgi:bifunctional DNA-binding transcriptional regulator/antitoxin component of YhaV-PrlF toxin-antitoxin module
MHAQIRVRAKSQMTIPTSIVKEAGIQEGDLLAFTFRGGVLSLDLRKNKPSKPSVMKYVGVTQGTYGKTAEQVDAYIRQERDSWER